MAKCCISWPYRMIFENRTTSLSIADSKILSFTKVRTLRALLYWGDTWSCWPITWWLCFFMQKFSKNDLAIAKPGVSSDRKLACLIWPQSRERQKSKFQWTQLENLKFLGLRSNRAGELAIAGEARLSDCNLVFLFF